MSVRTFKAISRKLPEGLAVENEVRKFKVTMDEPEPMGGTDQGMTPMESILMALGTCQIIVGYTFAKARGIELRDMWVEVEGDFDPAGFLKGAEGVRRGFQAIRMSIHFESDADPEKLKDFADFIENRCPVTDNLANATDIASEIIVA